MVSIQSLDSTKVYFISYILCESPGSSPTIPNIEGKKQELRTETRNRNNEQKQRTETKNRNKEQKQGTDNRREKQTVRETEKKK